MDDDEIALFDALVPHIRRTLLVQRRVAVLEAERSASLEALGSLGQGVLLVDAHCGPLHANRLAERLLEARDGLQLTRGALVCHDARQSDLLRGLIADAAGLGTDGSLVLQRKPGLAPFSVQVAPLSGEPGWLPAEGPAALLCITDPEAVTPVPADHLRALYGLTRAEAATALGLLGSDGLIDLARRMGVSLCTVRTHLQRVFEKTGTNRQAQLVRLLLAHRQVVWPLAPPGTPARMNG